MKTEEIALSRVVENEENPRTITTEKFQKLVKSILVFPRMLTLRPIVVDETFKVLGGNMRLKALRHITTMQEDGILAKLEEDTHLTEAERNLESPTGGYGKRNRPQQSLRLTTSPRRRKKSSSSRTMWASETGTRICWRTPGIPTF